MRRLNFFQFVSSLALGCSLMFLTSCGRDKVNHRLNQFSRNVEQRMGGVASTLTSTHRNYDFFQAFGGLVVETPVLKEGGLVYLPMKADLSGASNLNGHPGDIGRKVAFKSLEVKKDKADSSRIYVYINTARKSEKTPSQWIKGGDLGYFTPGTYTVEYLNRNGDTVPLTAFRIDVSNE